jgi:hypothetical protein
MNTLFGGKVNHLIISSGLCLRGFFTHRSAKMKTALPNKWKVARAGVLAAAAASSRRQPRSSDSVVVVNGVKGGLGESRRWHSQLELGTPRASVSKRSGILDVVTAKMEQQRRLGRWSENSKVYKPYSNFYTHSAAAEAAATAAAAVRSAATAVVDAAIVAAAAEAADTADDEKVERGRERCVSTVLEGDGVELDGGVGGGGAPRANGDDVGVDDAVDVEMGGGAIITGNNRLGWG